MKNSMAERRAVVRLKFHGAPTGKEEKRKTFVHNHLFII